MLPSDDKWAIIALKILTGAMNEENELDAMCDVVRMCMM